MRSRLLPFSRLAVLALALATAAGAEVTPPVPLYTPPLMVPAETAGSRLAPEASVRITIDARGVVERVEMLAIRPSTEHDPLFRATLEATLSRWRYAPQLRDGIAEPTTLEWRVRFPARDEAEDGIRIDVDADRVGPLDFDAELRRALVLALPAAQRLEMLEVQTAIATSLLDPRRLREARTDWVVVRADTEDPKVATLVARNIEVIFRTLAAKLTPGIEPAPEHHPLHVVVYSRSASYAELMTRTVRYEWSAGFYSPIGLIAFHLEQSSDDAATKILLHEATHAFLDRHVVRRGVALPRWLGEGFADYVGNSRVRKGILQPGKTLRNKFEMGREGAVHVETSGALQLDAARLALRRGRGLGVPELLAAAPETFYGENRNLFYASAWLLVHFLRDGDAGWAEDRFARLMLYAAEGYPADAVVRDLYGETAALDTAFRAYVRSF
jgi:hypothetical protein